MYSASANYSVQFGRFNLFGIFMYDTEINITLPAFFIEGDKVVETFKVTEIIIRSVVDWIFRTR